MTCTWLLGLGERLQGAIRGGFEGFDRVSSFSDLSSFGAWVRAWTPGGGPGTEGSKTGRSAARSFCSRRLPRSRSRAAAFGSYCPGRKPPF